MDIGTMAAAYRDISLGDLMQARKDAVAGGKATARDMSGSSLGQELGPDALSQSVNQATGG